jgi:hypothetical protein
VGTEIVELIMRVEEEFEIEIPDVDAETLNTVGALHRYLVQKLATNPSSGFDAASSSNHI